MTEFIGECVDGPQDCQGAVAEYAALSGSGMFFPRCERHYGCYVERVQPRIDEINRRYPASPPEDFDPYYGESWAEDDY